MKILLIEDDEQTRSYIANGMKEAGHCVDMADNGEDGLFLATTNAYYDVAIVDRMLPQLDGLTIIKTIRGADNTLPVIILSALGEVDDRVKGLREGGDDYLVKPFCFAELLARVEILGRRRKQPTGTIETTLHAGALHMDLLSRKVKLKDENIDLQSREFRLLEYLLKHKGQIVTRTMLLEAVWDYHFDPQTNIIDVHISRLRKKIHDHDATIIKTVRGSGYIIDDPE